MIGALLRMLGKLVRPKPSVSAAPVLAAPRPVPVPVRIRATPGVPEKVALPPIAPAATLAHPSRTTAIVPAMAAAYWKESLNFLDFQQVAAIGKDALPPLLLIEADKIGARGAAQASDDDKPAQDVFVVLALWSANRAGGFVANGVRHPLLCVHASQSGDKLFFPRLDVAPRLNDAYLEPGAARRAFSLGNGDDLNGLLLRQLAGLLDQDSQAMGWRAYWDIVTGFLASALGVADLPGLEALLSGRANELDAAATVRRYRNKAAVAAMPARHWKLAAAVYPSDRSAVRQIERIYDSLLVAMDAYRAETALFRQLCTPADTVGAEAIPDAARSRMLGHIDEYEKDGRRALFPLDPTQRQAVHAILGLRSGEIQAVNGPPGSGKTSMLRAVVASLWVEAAIGNAACPIVVACGGTNQSVTNVIEAFGSAPHLDDGLPFARRWIAGASSYGAYLPAGSVLAKKADELKPYVCLKWANNGFLWEYANRENILLPSRSFAYEAAYLNHAEGIWSDGSAATVEGVVALINTRLRELDQKRRQFLLAVARRANWEALAAEFLAQHAGCWSAKRRGEADKRLVRLRANVADLAAADEFVDLAWRADSFHWAARYWEGRFLLAQRTRLLSRHPKNIEEALRRLCMLTPCIVSTMHTVGQLAAIDQEVDGYATERTHCFGLFDLLVVDEAGQAQTSLGAAAFALARTAAVVGDLKQLAPIAKTTVLSELAIAKRVGAQAELEGIVASQRSVASGSVLGMAKLVSRYTDGPDPGVSLRFHYRCKPSIIAYCSMLCYDGNLVPCTDEDEPFPEPALGWVDIDAVPVPVGGSFRNAREADEIAEWIAQRWPEWQRHPATRDKKLQEVVAIVTPYAAQSAYLETALARTFNALRAGNQGAWPSSADVADVTIGTVHRLQGAERPIVCFSLVEGPGQNGASFIDRDRSMLNVAVSRAKRAFLIFAHPGRLFGSPGAPDDVAADASHRLGRYLLACGKAQRLYPKQLVLIEAQGKRASMARILGKPSLVMATSGALTRLEPGAGVDIAAGFVPRPVLEKRAPAVLAGIRAALSRVDALCLATDDDRMGEYIAWQAQRLLQTDIGARTVGRVRLGGITRAFVNRAFAQPGPIDEGKVMAETVREIVDCLVAKRFADAAREGNGQAPTHPRAPALVRAGALTDAQDGTVSHVGRVQAAVLRLLLESALEVDGQSHLRRIEVTATVAGARLAGDVVLDGRDRFDETEVPALRTLLESARIVLLSNTQHCAPATPPAASTVALLAQAWRRHALPPGAALASLQSLYDGSWAADLADYDPIDPIEPPQPASGHPPVVPLDRADTPLRLRGSLGETDFRMYELVWDFFQVAQTAGLAENVAEVAFAVQGQPGLQLRFRASGSPGLAPELAELVLAERGAAPRQTVEALQAGVFALPTERLAYASLPAAEWDMAPDLLLRRMEQRRIGRPSTFVAALATLERKRLVDFPRVAGRVRLTPDGLATALALADKEPRLSDPGFSLRLSTMLAGIETGNATPREVLETLMPVLTPDYDPSEVGPRIWASLPELGARIDAAEAASNASVTKISGEPGSAPPFEP